MRLPEGLPEPDLKAHVEQLIRDPSPDEEIVVGTLSDATRHYELNGADFRARRQARSTSTA